MTNEEIIELAKHQKWLGNADGWTFNSRQQLITFANAIAQRTRDECADLCEEYGWGVGDRCADKIRSMK